MSDNFTPIDRLNHYLSHRTLFNLPSGDDLEVIRDTMEITALDNTELRAALAAKDAEIERLREALSNAAHALDVVRSAISSGQIVDKDALGTAKRGRDAARAALENSHE